MESIRLITLLSGHAVFYLDIAGDNLSDWLDIMSACLYLQHRLSGSELNVPGWKNLKQVASM